MEYAIVRNFSKQPFLNERGRNIPVMTFGRKTIFQMNPARTKSVPLTADTCLLRLYWLAKNKELIASMLLRVKLQNGKTFEASIPIPMASIRKIYEKYEELRKKAGRQRQAYMGAYTEIYMTPEQEKELDEEITKIRAENERKKLLKKSQSSQQGLYTQKNS